RAQLLTGSAATRSAAGRLNPTVGFTPGYNFNSLPGTPPWIPGMTVDIPVETAGKRQKRITHAELLAASAQYNLASAAWQVRSNLRSALIELWFTDRRRDLLQSALTN